MSKYDLVLHVAVQVDVHVYGYMYMVLHVAVQIDVHVYGYMYMVLYVAVQAIGPSPSELTHPTHRLDSPLHSDLTPRPLFAQVDNL